MLLTEAPNSSPELVTPASVASFSLSGLPIRRL